MSKVRLVQLDSRQVLPELWWFPKDDVGASDIAVGLQAKLLSDEWYVAAVVVF